jgi:hypothetical protein
MQSAQIWTHQADVGERLDAWIHGDWKVYYDQDELVAETWATQLGEATDLPNLPDLKLAYPGRGVAKTCRGLLLWNSQLLALWADQAGKECGWELVPDREAAYADHAVQLLDEEEMESHGLYQFQWDRFEELLRKTVYGRAL